MKSLIKIIKHFEEILSTLALATMSVLVAIQVFERYVLNSSLSWSGEVSRYLLIWVVYIGCSFALQEERHLAVTVVREFSGRYKKFVLIFSDLITIMFCVFCFVYGIHNILFLMRTGQTSPALEIKMYIPYIAIPLGFGLMGIRSIMQLRQALLD